MRKGEELIFFGLEKKLWEIQWKICGANSHWEMMTTEFGFPLAASKIEKLSVPL